MTFTLIHKSQLLFNIPTYIRQSLERFIHFQTEKTRNLAAMC